jgi:hypothetical protein
MLRPMRALKRLWSLFVYWLGVAADFLQVSGAAGFTGMSLVGIGSAIVGFASGIPWYWVIVASPGAALLLLLAWERGLRIWDKKGRSADIDEWRGHNTYFVWVAACLWIGLRPWPVIDQEHPAYPALQRLKGAIEAGAIKIVSGSGGMNSRVTREELLRFAQSEQQKTEAGIPTFLL